MLLEESEPNSPFIALTPDYYEQLHLRNRYKFHILKLFYTNFYEYTNIMLPSLSKTDKRIDVQTSIDANQLSKHLRNKVLSIAVTNQCFIMLGPVV